MRYEIYGNRWPEVDAFVYDDLLNLNRESELLAGGGLNIDKENDLQTGYHVLTNFYYYYFYHSGFVDCIETW